MVYPIHPMDKKSLSLSRGAFVLFARSKGKKLCGLLAMAGAAFLFSSTMQASVLESDQKNSIAAISEGDKDAHEGVVDEHPTVDQVIRLAQFMRSLAQKEVGILHHKVCLNGVEKFYESLRCIYNLDVPGDPKRIEFLTHVMRLLNENRLESSQGNAEEGESELRGAIGELNDAIEEFDSMSGKLAYKMDSNFLNTIDAVDARKKVLKCACRCLRKSEDVSSKAKILWDREEELYDADEESQKAIGCVRYIPGDFGDAARTVIWKYSDRLNQDFVNFCREVSDLSGFVLNVRWVSRERIVEIFEHNKDFGRKLFPSLYK